jgi:hypothetical protein
LSSKDTAPRCGAIAPAAHPLNDAPALRGVVFAKRHARGVVTRGIRLDGQPTAVVNAIREVCNGAIGREDSPSKEPTLESASQTSEPLVGTRLNRTGRLSRMGRSKAANGSKHAE